MGCLYIFVRLFALLNMSFHFSDLGTCHWGLIDVYQFSHARAVQEVCHTIPAQCVQYLMSGNVSGQLATICPRVSSVGGGMSRVLVVLRDLVRPQGDASNEFALSRDGAHTRTGITAAIVQYHRVCLGVVYHLRVW